MKKNISFWLVPSIEDENYLSKIVKILSARFNAPLFRPHLTVWGGIEIEEEKTIEVAKRSIAGIKEFAVEVEKIDAIPVFLKSIFLQIKTNDQLDLIHSRLKQEFDKENYVLNPHISLVYGNFPTPMKQEMMARLDIKKFIQIDKVAVVAASEKGWEDIEGWRELFVSRV